MELAKYLLLLLHSFSYVCSQEISGFEFEDNLMPKYLTPDNGVAEVRTKECLFINLHKIAVFTDINMIQIKQKVYAQLFFFKVKVINIHDRYQTKLLSVHGFTQNGQDGVSSK